MGSFSFRALSLTTFDITTLLSRTPLSCFNLRGLKFSRRAFVAPPPPPRSEARHSARLRFLEGESGWVHPGQVFPSCTAVLARMRREGNEPRRVDAFDRLCGARLLQIECARSPRPPAPGSCAAAERAGHDASLRERRDSLFPSSLFPARFREEGG